MARDLYSAAWDFGRLNLGAVSGANAAVFASGTGGPAGNAGFASGMYMHGNVGMTGGTEIDGVPLLQFADDLDALLSGSSLAVQFSRSQLRYTISSANAFAVTWTGAQGVALRDILGFEANLSSAATHTSTKRPKYLICTRHAGQSAVKASHEPGGRIQHAESESGFQYDIGPDELATYANWTQPYETNIGPTDADWAGDFAVGGAPMRRTDVGAATKVYWTWEDFWKHVRATLPFALVDQAAGSNEGDVYKLHGDAAHFDPTRKTVDFDGHWMPAIKALYKGASMEF
ncbi:MAG: hypothetical protein WC211_00860 [Dehalococcoidia bacterium]